MTEGKCIKFVNCTKLKVAEIETVQIEECLYVQTKEKVSSLETWDVMKLHLLIYYPCNVLGSERTLTTSCRALLAGVQL